MSFSQRARFVVRSGCVVIAYRRRRPTDWPPCPLQRRRVDGVGCPAAADAVRDRRISFRPQGRVAAVRRRRCQTDDQGLPLAADRERGAPLAADRDRGVPLVADSDRDEPLAADRDRGTGGMVGQGDRPGAARVTAVRRREADRRVHGPGVRGSPQGVDVPCR